MDMRDRDRDRGDRGGDRDMGDERGVDALWRRRGRRRVCRFCADKAVLIDYKDPQALRYFVTERGKIVPRRISGSCAKHQRAVTMAIKQARTIALLPFTLAE
ncbi:MAG: 30S ribosomal protein S18 [Myxococcales bacterium]|nr:30S ribosomal protein S18 [Myxococcales bacterium]MCC6522184.1 30S ribosomal protein S18 [Polyangiaceae bacterium]